MMKMPKEPCVFECEVSVFWFDETGFLHACFKKGVVRTLERQKAAFELIRSITNDQPVCLLGDVSDCSLILLDEKIKEYIAAEMPLLFKAVAVLAPYTLQKVAPTIFINTMKPTVPIQIFDEKEEAMEWLKQYL